MHSILVPVDGSVHSNKAVHIACDLADKYGGHIALFHSLLRDKQSGDFLGLSVTKAFSKPLISALKAAAKSQAGQSEGAKQQISEKLLLEIGNKILSEAAAGVKRRNLDVKILEIGIGDPAESILLAAKQAKSNTIVMGCRGGRDDVSSAFGSVSHKVFQGANCTCISVK